MHTDIEVCLHSFFISVIFVSEWSTSGPGNLTSGEISSVKAKD
jgi:hypothetical protein